MIPFDIGLPSYVLYGPSTFASSMEASRDAKYIVSKMSAKEEMKDEVNNFEASTRFVAIDQSTTASGTDLHRKL